MELNDWNIKDTFEEAVLTLENGDPLLVLRKINNERGVVRGPTGVLLQEVDVINNLDETVESCLTNAVKRILDGDFLTIQQRLGLPTMEVTREFRESFMKEVREYTDYGECEVCHKESGRAQHDATNKKVLKVCQRCKLKLMFFAQY